MNLFRSQMYRLRLDWSKSNVQECIHMSLAV